jgi:hypothetical protein
MIRYPDDEDHYLTENKSSRNVFWPYPLVTLSELDLSSSEYQFLVQSDEDVIHFIKERNFNDDVKIVLPQECSSLLEEQYQQNIYYFSIEDSRTKIPEKLYDLNLCKIDSHLVKDLSDHSIKYNKKFMENGLNLYLLLGIHKLAYYSNIDNCIDRNHVIQSIPLTPYHVLSILRA